ncbi:hypothetical protein D9M72_495040 [compost metagenome]
MRAVANWVTTHSGRFGAQMPTRSPGWMPRWRRPLARRSTWSLNSAQFQRTPCSRNTTAGPSGFAATVRASSAGIV